ncbi:MAG: hypothetical protein IJN49_05490 [Clostridia bacterium]|nr:hypothetical protein [Clostridia bacterium]
MKLTPAMKIILAVAAICIAITLITTNNIATVMVLHGLNTTPAVATQGNNTQGTVNNSNQGGGYVDNSVNTNTNTNTSTGTDANANTSTNNNTATTPSGSTSTDNNSSANNNADAQKPSGDSGAAQSGKLSDQQVVDLYKTAMNNARTKSSSVVRVKDGAINYKGIVEAGKLSSVASTLMGMFMAKDANSIEAKNEPWEKEKLPDASALTPNGLQKISYEEKGGQYIVTLVAKNAVSPKANSDGVGSLSGVIEESQITGAIGSVPGLTLEGISIDYENVTAVATIDKASGNLVAFNIDAPCVLKIGHAKVPLLGEVNDAKVGIQVITEYTIAY